VCCCQKRGRCSAVKNNSLPLSALALTVEFFFLHEKWTPPLLLRAGSASDACTEVFLAASRSGGVGTDWMLLWPPQADSKTFKGMVKSHST
jgi:hypothetical protein